MPSKRIVIFFAVALLLEVVVLEMTVGINMPTDRASARSTVVIKFIGTGLHFITDNKRFSVVDYWVDESHIQTLVLRESVLTDRQAGIEGARGPVTVEAFVDSPTNRPKWRIRQEGHVGEVVDDRFYKVTKRGCCDARTTYSYFALQDGKKLYEGTDDLTFAQWNELH
jgi:hypothetical protein